MSYLKCNYSEGMFSNEYVITINIVPPTNENWLIVNREDVIRQTRNNGLVKLRDLEDFGDYCLVGINDVGDRRISRRYVPKEDIVKDSSFSRKTFK